MLKNEIKALRRMINCPNSISLYRVYETEDRIFLITEYANSGTLIDLIKQS